VSAPPRRSYPLQPIGYVRTSHSQVDLTPIQSLRNPLEEARLVVLPEYAPALEGLEEFDYLHLLTLLDRVPEHLPEQPGQLVQIPFMLQESGEAVGVFASRFPVRPNRLGLSLVRVLAVRGRTVDFAGVDMLDWTPVLDLKPWEQHLDVPGWPSPDLAAIRGGWYQRTGATSRAGRLAGRRSLERAGMLEPTPEESMDMELSARNQLKGVIRGVKTGQLMAEITVDVEAGSVVAAITDSSRERLNLQDGDQVTVFVKSTEVMIGK
jgi:tRNA (adenine37-N6)-methyltransferase